MTEIERKALALIAEIKAERGLSGPDYLSARAALIRAIEQHEAFKREVSDAVEALLADTVWSDTERRMIAPYVSRFIIPKPADPLLEVIASIGIYSASNERYALELREALAARGLKIVEVE